VAKLVVFRGDSVERELHVGLQAVRIGRDAANDVMLDDKRVSRFHAELVREGGNYFVSDLNSRNGVWVNKQRINARAPLELGVPVTIGDYELTLEDDLGTSDLGDMLPAASRTMVSTAPGAVVEDRASSSSTRAKAASSSATSTAAANAVRKPAVFWSAIGIGTLALCLVTYLVVRRATARPPVPEPVAVATVTLPPVETPATTPAPTTPVTQDIVAGYLEAAQFAIDEHDYAAAADDIDAALELDPNNADLLARKKQVQDQAAAPPPPVVKPTPKPPPQEVVAEVTGIPRRAGESPTEYNARVARIRDNMAAGTAALDRGEFGVAITRLRAVERDQKGYSNVEALLADAEAQLKKAVDTAINNGQENERAGQLVNAVRWYERAVQLDPNSAAAQDKLAGIADRRTKRGLEALTNADVLRKRNQIAKAVVAYQEAADLLPSTNDKKAEAQQWLEKLKQ
jgi:pSer/pThr/pTyr-binding forkhead associated (FHA) protein